MMDMYSLQRLAYTEHDLMVRSLPKVHDYTNLSSPKQSHWLRLSAELRAIGARLRVTALSQQTRTRPSLTLSNPSVFLRDQLREDSNSELDWLWAASQVTAAEEIRYCLERALYINPDNHATQQTLSKIVACRTAANETRPVNGQGFAQASNR